MALLRSLGLTVLVSALTAGGLSPAAAASGVPGQERPVSVIALTTDAGELTELAETGWRRWHGPSRGRCGR